MKKKLLVLSILFSSICSYAQQIHSFDGTYRMITPWAEELKESCMGNLTCLTGEGHGSGALAFLFLGIKVTINGNQFTQSYDIDLHAQTIGVTIPKEWEERMQKEKISRSSYTTNGNITIFDEKTALISRNGEQFATLKKRLNSDDLDMCDDNEKEFYTLEKITQ